MLLFFHSLRLDRKLFHCQLKSMPYLGLSKQLWRTNGGQNILSLHNLTMLTILLTKDLGFASVDHAVYRSIVGMIFATTIPQKYPIITNIYWKVVKILLSSIEFLQEKTEIKMDQSFQVKLILETSLKEASAQIFSPTSTSLIQHLARLGIASKNLIRLSP